MATVSDEALERRRVQNRMAQRRFRQKRQRNREAEENRQIQDGTFSLYPEAMGLDACFGDFVLSPAPTASSPVHVQSSQAQASGLYGGVTFVDLENEFSRGSLVLPATGPGDASEQGLAGDSSEAGRGSSSQADRKKSIEHAATTRIESIEHSPGSLSLLGQSAPGSTSSGSSSASGSGWLSALHMAAQRGHSGIVRFLLQQNIDSNERDSDGLTPLMHATANGHEEVVSMLLAHGTRLSDVDSHHRSALHWAVLSRNAALMRLLLKHAAGDPLLLDGYDDYGRTPLHTAIDLGFEPGVTILLEFGANVHSRARKD